VPFAVRGLLRDGTSRLTEREGARGGYGTVEGVEFLPTILRSSS
jgi:hypothetical protein